MTVVPPAFQVPLAFSNSKCAKPLVRFNYFRKKILFPRTSEIFRRTYSIDAPSLTRVNTRITRNELRLNESTRKDFQRLPNGKDLTKN
jgi:hypothetical protein